MEPFRGTTSTRLELGWVVSQMEALPTKVSIGSLVSSILGSKWFLSFLQTDSSRQLNFTVSAMSCTQRNADTAVNTMSCIQEDDNSNH